MLAEVDMSLLEKRSKIKPMKRSQLRYDVAEGCTVGGFSHGHSRPHIVVLLGKLLPTVVGGPLGLALPGAIRSQLLFIVGVVFDGADHRGVGGRDGGLSGHGLGLAAV